jgi:DNA-directed RNA polymerase subunit K/omega
MIELPEKFDSIYRYIVVVSQRAEQLINGAKPRRDSKRAKPTLHARDEVDGGDVKWRILTQEELDAHRQAMVEQFRAEVDAAAEPQEEQAIPDVLPTGDTPAVAEAGDEERDDELERLQRLLGMSKGAAADDSGEEAEAETVSLDEAKEDEEAGSDAVEDED